MSHDKDEKLSQDLDKPRPRGTEPETAMGAASGENYDHTNDQPVDAATGRTSDASDAPARSGGEVSDATANPTPPVQEALTTPGVEDTPQTAPDQRH